MNYFVFVVCGTKEHTDTLNFSLKFIRHFSRFPALVVTDARRNEAQIEHDHIIDIETPEHFDHHQASIYLKTNLHRILNIAENDIYCYLDSDIVAISDKINSIFDCFEAPVKFARDHCGFDEFSPHAMNCGCLEDVNRREQEYRPVDNFFRSRFFANTKLFSEDRKALDNQFETLKQFRVRSLVSSLRYLMLRYPAPVRQFRFGQFVFNKRERFWYNDKGEIIHIDYRYYARKLKRETGAHYNYKENKWLNRNDEDITPKIAECRHLRNHIFNKYGVDIPGNWNHWNGGVFLFNRKSFEFLDYWNKTSIEEFDDTATKTRDQGTLALSAWRFNLQNAPVLNKEYNFITEFKNDKIAYSPSKGFTYDGFVTSFNPYFLHIYHEWGHKGWSIWDYVEELKETV